ncbi:MULTISPECIES: MarR family transcriptional regulator [unclassified Streptomyces]|uniref:MarR family winged helix-turn-helix transcriptional regulator n=1 Tax=unclassified Streptomyces TaxID=2593676 RepID=UPI0033C43307
MPNTTPSAPEMDLMFLLSWASHALATEQTAALSGLGITPRAYCVLYKALPGNLTQRRLAEICGLDKSTMVVTVDELEKAGLAERRPSSTDRRVRIIHVTPKGMEMIAEANQIVARVQRDVLSALPQDQREGFTNGLAVLVEGRLSTLTPSERPPRRPSVRS